MSIAYLLSGSNEGDRSGNLQKARSHLRNLAGEIRKCSPVFESPAWGFEHPTHFLNQALELHTALSAEDLLKTILRIEEECGRVRSETGGYEARTLDIDILFFDCMVIASPELTIPHPRLHLRRFALLPLSRIAGELMHPTLDKSITELLMACPDATHVSQIEDCCCACREKEERV
jgi:2-amino-4-hydroxy-6-hydroxymethyldihydropteridine diphosphokinase